MADPSKIKFRNGEIAVLYQPAEDPPVALTVINDDGAGFVSQVSVATGGNVFNRRGAQRFGHTAYIRKLDPSSFADATRVPNPLPSTVALVPLALEQMTRWVKADLHQEDGPLRKKRIVVYRNGEVYRGSPVEGEVSTPAGDTVGFLGGDTTDSAPGVLGPFVDTVEVGNAA